MKRGHELAVRHDGVPKLWVDVSGVEEKARAYRLKNMYENWFDFMMKEQQPPGLAVIAPRCMVQAA